MLIFSPDSSGNPFYFFFKNKKIATDSGRMDLKKSKLLLQKNLESQHLRNLKTKKK
jgi:hypothetical protein